MKPEPPRVLQGVMINLAMTVTPEVQTPYGQQVVQLAAGLVNIVGQEFDRAADRLVTEREALRSLFGRARWNVTDANLKERLGAAAQEPPEASLRIPALQAENDRLRALLIELHTHVETMDTPEGRDLDAEIWEELKESTRRRHVVSGL